MTHWRHAASVPSEGTWCWVTNEAGTELALAAVDSRILGGWRFAVGSESPGLIAWFWPVELPLTMDVPKTKDLK